MAVSVFASEGGDAGVLCFRQVKEITDPELILDWVWEAISSTRPSSLQRL